MTRTTLNLDPSVMRELRAEARPEAPPFAWVSRDLGKPAVDLQDKEALAALLDR